MQTTPDGILDGFSRALDDRRGVPDVISLSYDLASGLGLPNWASLPATLRHQADLTRRR